MQAAKTQRIWSWLEESSLRASKGIQRKSEVLGGSQSPQWGVGVQGPEEMPTMWEGTTSVQGFTAGARQPEPLVVMMSWTMLKQQLSPAANHPMRCRSGRSLLKCKARSSCSCVHSPLPTHAFTTELVQRSTLRSS